MPGDAKKLVKKASQLMKPVEKLDCETKKNKTTDGETITFDYMWATHLTDEDFEWVFGLFKANMLEMYQKSQWGYDENSKRNELRATTSRFIIALNEKGEKIGYTTYRFVVDHNVPVTYCWELQVLPAYQNKGIGGMMLDTLERLSSKTNMEKVMATVFLYNAPSLGFFHKHGFVSDITCPSDDSGLDYAILSKYSLMPVPWIQGEQGEQVEKVEPKVNLVSIDPPVPGNTVDFRKMKNSNYCRELGNRRRNLQPVTSAKTDSTDLNKFCEDNITVLDSEGLCDAPDDLIDEDVSKALSDERLINNLGRAHVTILNAVQLRSLGYIRDGLGVMVEAPTGIGKTYAFLIPTIEKALKERKERLVQPTKPSPTALIIAPTGTLAKQLFNRCELLLGLKMMDDVIPIDDIKVGLLIAEHRFSAEECDIAFCTMGKLKSLIEDKSLCLDNLKMIVLDEADKMVDNAAFGLDIVWVLDQLKEDVMNNLQSCLFSATYPRQYDDSFVLTELQARMLGGKPWKLVYCPRLTGYITQNVIKIGNEQGWYRSPWHKKVIEIRKLIDKDLEETNCKKEGPFKETITIFCETVGRVAQVATALRLLGYKFDPVCRTILKGQQEVTLNDLEFKKIQGIVCTNVMARGIDVSSVKHTIIMEMSTDFDTYRHRIGRVGRDGSGGKATVLIDQDQLMNGQTANLIESLYRFMKEGGDVPEWMEHWFSLRYPKGYQ